MVLAHGHSFATTNISMIDNMTYEEIFVWRQNQKSKTFQIPQKIFYLAKSRSTLAKPISSRHLVLNIAHL